MQRFFRRFQSPGGVQSRRELEADFVSADFVRCLRGFFQRQNSGALGFVQLPQAGGNQNPVFAGERNQVGDRAERDQIQQRFQIKFRRAGEICFAPAFDQGMRELEGEAGGAKLGERSWELGAGSWGFTSANAFGAGDET